MLTFPNESPQSQTLISIQGGFHLRKQISVHVPTIIKDLRALSSLFADTLSKRERLSNFFSFQI